MKGRREGLFSTTEPDFRPPDFQREPATPARRTRMADGSIPLNGTKLRPTRLPTAEEHESMVTSLLGRAAGRGRRKNGELEAALAMTLKMTPAEAPLARAPEATPRAIRVGKSPPYPARQKRRRSAPRIAVGFAALVALAVVAGWVTVVLRGGL